MSEFDAHKFLKAAAVGPSRHREFPLIDRIAMYRRVIAHLRLEHKPDLTWRQKVELKTAISEGMIITGVRVADAATQIKYLRDLLEECMGRKEAIDHGFIREGT